MPYKNLKNSKSSPPVVKAHLTKQSKRNNFPAEWVLNVIRSSSVCTTVHVHRGQCQMGQMPHVKSFQIPSLIWHLIKLLKILIW